MQNKAISFLCSITLCFTLLCSAALAADGTGLSASYSKSSGVVTVTAEGLTPDASYPLISVQTESSVLGLGAGETDGDGDLEAAVPTGTLAAGTYSVYIFQGADGTVAAQGSFTVSGSDSSAGSTGGGSSGGVTRYTITVEQNPGGEITPDTTRVVRGQDQTFRIRADEGYEIEDVLVDGESVGSVSSYTFENVRKAHTIEAVFRAAGEEPGQADRPFTDVDPNGWAAEYIYYLYDRGVVSGVGANQFAPTRSITRAEFVKMLAGVAGVTEEELSGSSGFADVDSGSWYAPFVTWAVQSGVTTGTSATTFSPEANITREEMAVMIDRFAQSSGVELPSGDSAAFTDAASFSSWATEAIYTMQRAGIIDGVGGGRFAPKDNATREQACKMLAVLMELI